MTKHIVESTLYGNVILILVLASNFWSSLAQDVVDQQSQDGGSDFLPGIPGPGSNRDEAIAARVMFNDLEPTCEELRAMWRVSRRQLRAPEISNELPTYRDPFKSNIWDPFYVRQQTRMRTGKSRYFGTRHQFEPPTYGTIKYKAPEKSFVPVGRSRSYSYNDLSRLYSKGALNGGAGGAAGGRGGQRNWVGVIGRPANNDTASGRSGAQFRIGRIQTHAVPMNSLLTPQKGSFQRLKDLVWSERANELAQQRRNEELIARAAVLQDLTKGQQRFKRSLPWRQ